MRILFEKLQEEKDAKKRADGFREAAFLLLDHMQSEETAFYPALGKKADHDKLEGIEEHNVMKPLVQQLSLLEPADPAYAAKLEVLAEINEHHMKEEERDMFPRYRKTLSKEELEELGEKVAAVQETLRESR